MSDLLWGLVQVAVVLAIPYLGSHLVSEQLLHRLVTEEFKAIPILDTLARVEGWLLGGLLLYTNLDASYFDLEHLFVSGSRWGLTIGEFLGQRANLFAYDPSPLFELLWPKLFLPWLASVLAIILLPALLILLCRYFWRSRQIWRALLGCTITALWSAWMAVYLVCLVCWGLYVLNYWVFAVLTLYLQFRKGQGHGH